MRFRHLILWLCIPIWFACGPDLTAQVTGATIRGEVLDSSNLAVPGAQVTVTNLNTGLRRTVKSNEVGIYIAPELPIGSYHVEAEAAGFKKSIRENVQCNVVQVVRVDFTLEVGQVSESVTVEAAAPSIATETTSLGNLRYGQQIQSLPLNARGLSGLYTLTAGVPVYSNGVNPAATGFVDNNGVGDTGFLIDGTVGNSPINGNSGNVPSLNGRVIEQDMPNLESVAEFKFNTSNDKAEFGQITSISVVTKSGTNDLHGSAFEYNRVGATSARSFFAPTRESLTRNQYGVSLGGPVLLPGSYNGRNRTFFFGAWEGFRDHRQFPVTGKFPNSKERAGDLSVLLPATPLRDPDGGFFPNNVIPPSRISPVTRGMLAYVPIPAGDQSATAASAFNFAGAKPQIDHTDKFDVKGDHRFSDRDSLSARFTYSDNFNHWTNSSPLPNEIGLGLQDTLARQFSISETHLFSAAHLNEVRVGYWRKRRFVRVGLNDVDFLTGDQAIPGIHPPPPFQGLPSVTINSSLLGVSPNMFTASTTDRRAAEDAMQATDNYTLIHGRHTLKFGGDVRRPRINNYSVAAPAGNFAFTSSTSTANSATGDSFADFLLGFPQTSSWAVAKDGYSRAWQYFFYAQDDFKVTSRLMINYGLRWEYYGKFGELYGRDANYDFPLRKVVVPAAGRPYFLPNFVGNPLIVDAETVGLGKRLINPDLNNFAPRIGLAYQPFGSRKTVVRAAYGIFYTPPSGFLNFQTAQGPPYNASYTYSRATAIGAGGTPPSFSNPVATGGASANLLAAVNSLSRDYRDLYSQVWNFTIEQALPRDFSLRASYVGNRGTRLYRQVYANACLAGPVACDARAPDQSPRADVNFPDTGGGIQTVGKSIYNALQAEVEKRYANGLFFNANYTFGRLIALTASPADPIGNASLDRGRDPTSITSFFHVNAVWDLPFGPGRRFLGGVSGAAAKVLGGWQLAGLLHAQSGQPFTVTAPAADTGTGSSTNRADRIADGRLPTDRSRNDELNRWFDTSAFRRSGRGLIGTGSVGELIGPGMFNADATLMKNTVIHERLNVQFRAEFFNVFNHPNFDLPVADVTSTAFGRIANTNPYLFPRQIQFGLRLGF
jgi:hypothetical protein